MNEKHYRMLFCSCAVVERVFDRKWEELTNYRCGISSFFEQVFLLPSLKQSHLSTKVVPDNLQRCQDEISASSLPQVNASFHFIFDAKIVKLLMTLAAKFERERVQFKDSGNILCQGFDKRMNALPKTATFPLDLRLTVYSPNATKNHIER